MHKSIFALSLLALSGCSSLTGATFENKLTCSAGDTEAFLVSKYGPIGISTSFSAKDSVAICAAIAAYEASKAGK
jgi:hypothetical protein